MLSSCWRRLSQKRFRGKGLLLPPLPRPAMFGNMKNNESTFASSNASEMRNSAAGTGKKAAGAAAGKTGAAADAGRDEAIRHWYKGENRDTIIYLLIAIFFLELIIGGIAFFYGIMHAKPSLAGGPPEAQFPILGWAIGAVAAPVALLLIVHLSGLWVSNTLERERQPGKPGSERMVPKRLRYFYACVQHAPTVVILLGILLLAAALVFVDGMFSAVLAFGAALKPYIPWIAGSIAALLAACYLGRLLLIYRHRRMEQEYAYRREVLEKTGIVLVSKGSIPLNRGIEPLQAVDGGGYALPPGPAYTPEEAAADAAALEAGEKKGDAPVEDIVDVDPEDLGEAPKNTAAPRKDDVTDADVVVEDGKPRA